MHGRHALARRVLALTGAAALATGATALAAGATALAAKPTIEHIDIDDTFADESLTEACGVPVTSTVSGHVTIRTFGEGSPNAEVSTINVGITSTGPGGTITFRDVGADLTRIAPNGDLIVLITGQVPFEFTGSLVIDDTTGEVIREPQHSTMDRIDEACATLAG